MTRGWAFQRGACLGVTPMTYRNALECAKSKARLTGSDHFVYDLGKFHIVAVPILGEIGVTCEILNCSSSSSETIPAASSTRW